jgi:restriction system protein
MPVPGFQEITAPLLRICADGKEWSCAAAREPIASQFGLTDEDLKELLPSGTQTRFVNRLAWAKIYLERAGLLAKTRRGYFEITDAGRRVLENCPPIIGISFLNNFDAFQGFRNRSSGADDEPESQDDSGVETPEEQLQSAHSKLREDLAREILSIVRAASPEFFERLVLKLMLAMGYGSARTDAGTLTEAGADKGIDAIINEDRLGLDTIYLQAKRWSDTVGRPEIHKFVGALHGMRARKGVFLTTSTFSREAIEYATQIDTKVVLIDGMTLARHMIDFNVGCQPVQIFEIKRIDSDFFVEE